MWPNNTTQPEGTTERCGSCKHPIDDHATVIINRLETRHICPDIGTGASPDYV